MKISKRLKTIASLVEKEAIVVDIGCDHGLLVIYLMINKIIKKAYACDVNIGPLDNVKNNIKIYNVDNIECILSNGLNNLKNIEYNTVVIAGMGGSLIIDILNDNLDEITNKSLILQPNVNSYALRKFLIKNNFYIEKEELVEENNIIYEIIKAKPGKSLKLTKLQYMYGKHNLIKKEPLLIKKMEFDLNKYKNIVAQLPNNSENASSFYEKINLIEVYLNEIRQSN